MKFPLASTDAFFPIITKLYIIGSVTTNGGPFNCGNGPQDIPCPASYHLPEGSYDIHFKDGSGSSSNRPIIVKNVLIRKGYETRLKVGYVSHLNKGLYQVYDESMQTPSLRYTSQTASRYPIPIGNYWVKLWYVGEYRVQMKDGEVVVLNPKDSATIPKSKWVVTSVLSKNERLLQNFGRLNTAFPEASNRSVSIRIPDSRRYSGYSDVDLKMLKFYDLLPGNYRVYLNGMPVEVSIQAGKETKLRFGHVKVNIASGEGWGLHDAENGAYLTGGDYSWKIALPIGYYRIVINYRSYLIKINEGENLDFRL